MTLKWLVFPVRRRHKPQPRCANVFVQLGSRGSTEVPTDVGAILSRRERDRVSVLGRCDG